MTEFEIAAPLAAALAAKGYASLTPVQAAVMAPEAAGRDLLVSAQTGSGKTVAFGLAIAPEILAGSARLLYADTPLALAIAPTRELALQVARELQWLYAEAGAQIATCVGGMDYRTERRALERGAHIVVGTPGRLRDHIDRGGLDLSGLRACILDEADEMLDLGFREDLEFILGAAPEDRRTLMFSATVPKAIAELAKTFQSDALRIQTAGESRQHVDIEYRALNVTARDREHAIFNLLRFYEARTAIVFCKTRVNVSHLLARMGNRGFQVVSLSGELSQQERTHALQALRDGRARVCIATDVAARGIDLPGLELVIHADLPTNSETLLHRSGRTGRAGAKGVSALIVTPADFKKAQRLLQGARVVAEWAKAPSADEVRARDDARILDHPVLAAAPGEDEALADTLLDRFGPAQVAAAFIRLWREGRSAPEELAETAAVSATPSAPRERGGFADAIWFSVSVGHTGRAEARWLLPKICEAGAITKDGIGAIRVKQEETFVQIARDLAPRFGETVELEPGLTMHRLPGEPMLDRPERAPHAPDRRPPAPRPIRADTPEERAPRPDRQADRPIPASAPRPDVPAAFAPHTPTVRDKGAPKPSAPHGKGGKSAGFKSHGAPRSTGAEARPSRATAFKSHKAADKVADAAPAEARPTTKGAKGGKPFGKSFGKPSHPRGAPADSHGGPAKRFGKARKPR